MPEAYLGQICLVGFAFAPRGWAFCAGQTMSINQNQALFSLLGTTYGGDGRTTFKLPDLRGRVPLHLGQGPGLSDYGLGQVGGQASCTLTVNELPRHTHQAVGYPTADVAAPTGAYFANSGHNLYAPAANGALATEALAANGGGQGHENRAPFLVLNYIIALTGIYPSRS